MESNEKKFNDSLGVQSPGKKILVGAGNLKLRQNTFTDSQIIADRKL
jgi:hypothetical protein